jgi:WS/DGAT/MGAT family acyltransferase
VQATLTAAGRLATLPFRAGWELADGARRLVSHRLGADVGPRSDEPVPNAIFNCDVGRERGFVFGAVPLDGVKAVKDRFGVTVNDVVLALVSTSLRRYLLERGNLPAASLRTSIAVSLRTDGDDDFSNHVTTATVTLATSVDDPAERLAAIAADSRRAKDEARHGGKGFLELMSLFPPALVNVALSVTPASIVPRAAGFNLLVSSVRGSPVPLYYDGARIEAMYPMSIIMPGGGLNVTCVSHADDIDVGLTIEPSCFPEPWTLVDGLRNALDEYLALADADPAA